MCMGFGASKQLCQTCEWALAQQTIKTLNQEDMQNVKQSNHIVTSCAHIALSAIDPLMAATKLLHDDPVTLPYEFTPDCYIALCAVMYCMSLAEVEGMKRKLVNTLSPTSASLMVDWEASCQLELSVPVY